MTRDGKALDILEQLAAEPDIHHRYSDLYANEFFVARRPFSQLPHKMMEMNEQDTRADAEKPFR